ncbi:MAG: class B sortase [Bacilli bacterium]|nr:class B sortase [Bacilli bacterium]
MKWFRRKRSLQIKPKLIFLGLIFIVIVASGYLVFMLGDDETKVALTDSSSKVSLEVDLSSNKVLEWQNYYNNNDIKGNITIDGISDFDYPIAQSIDNDYYLNHNYSKEYDKYGAIYADYRVNLDSSKKILIYGHSSIKKDVPFNELENYYSSDYYKEHKYITIETKTNRKRYEIFSVYVETNDFTYMNMNFDNEADWYLHLLRLQSKSLYPIDVELASDDEILIMQTCSKHPDYQNYQNKYLLIVSRRVKE